MEIITEVFTGAVGNRGLAAYFLHTGFVRMEKKGYNQNIVIRKTQLF